MQSELTWLFAIALSVTFSASAETLHLSCIGSGLANKTDQVMANGTNSDGDTAWATVQHSRSVGFADQVNIEIQGVTGRIRMPRVMLPVLHGGKDGWMELQKLVVGAREITGERGRELRQQSEAADRSHNGRSEHVG